MPVDKRAYLALAIALAQIPLRGTSDTLETLCEIHSASYEKKFICWFILDTQLVDF